MMDYLNQGLNQKNDMDGLIEEVNAQEEYVDEMERDYIDLGFDPGVF